MPVVAIGFDKMRALIFQTCVLLILTGVFLRADEDLKARRNALQKFQADCLQATPESLPGLIDRFAEIPPEDFLKGDAFFAVADAWLRQQSFPKDLVFPKNSALLPAEAPDASRNFAPAIRRYWDVTAPFRAFQQSRPSRESTRSFLGHEREYWDMVADILKNRNGPFADRVLAYTWGHWCGTGSDRFSNPQALLLFMALARDGRWPEAVGAALAVHSKGASVGLARALSAMLPHPEEVVAGGLALEGGQSDSFVREEAIRNLLALMLILPGDDRVKLLVELTGQAPRNSLRDYFRVLGKFVPRHPSERVKGGKTVWFGGWGGDLDAVTAEAASPVAQEQVENFLRTQAAPDLPVDAAKILVRIFRENRLPDRIPALRRLLDHPSQSVANEAASALTEAGESFVMPPKIGPVRYRLTVDGKPHAEREMSWQIPNKVGSTARTDAEGVLEISRDMFLDAGDVQEVLLHTAEITDPSQAWFGTLVSVPGKTDSPYPVVISTKSQKFALHLARPDSELSGRKMEVTLWGLQDEKIQRAGFWPPSRFVFPISQELVIPKIAPGTYRLEIRIPGHVSWSDLFTVGEEMEISLAKASDVTVDVRPPDGWPEGAVLPQLWQGGKRVSANWDATRRVFRGVSPGDYTLHIPSSAEIRKSVFGVLPDEPEFPAKDIPFTIPAEPPLDMRVE